MASQNFIYRPAEFADDKQLIEELTKCLTNLMATTEHYHLHFGSENKKVMKYWEQRSQILIAKMKQQPFIEPKTP